MERAICWLLGPLGSVDSQAEAAGAEFVVVLALCRGFELYMALESNIILGKGMKTYLRAIFVSFIEMLSNFQMRSEKGIAQEALHLFHFLPFATSLGAH